MNTEKLIQILSSDLANDNHLRIGPRLLGALAFGGMITLSLVLGVLGVQADLIGRLVTFGFWTKIVFNFSFFVVGLIVAVKTSQPGKTPPNYYFLMAIPVVVLWLIAIEAIRVDTSSTLGEMVRGSSWQMCSLLITGLSMPIFAFVMWALKDMASTRPSLTGFMAGLLSGGLGACIYCLHCPEYSPVFIGIWYFLGMMIPATIGALLGRRLLRW
jgi:hypothetical protein